MVTLAFIGVHGIGKTTTAKELIKNGFKYKPVEAIHVAYGLMPVERQTLFFVKYVYDFLSMLSRNPDANIAFDSHPLITLPYTEYWLSRSGVSERDIERTINSFKSILDLLPKIDLMVYLRMNSIDKVIERILSRRRFSAKEEIDQGYIRFIDRRLGEYVSAICSSLAINCRTVDGTLETEERVKKVLEILEEKDLLLAGRRGI